MTKEEFMLILSADYNEKDFGDYVVLDEPTPFNEFAKDKNFDRVQVQSITPIPARNINPIIFSGVFKWENNELTSLDGDCYNKGMEVYAYEEFTNEEHNIKSGLDIVVGNDW